MSGQICRPRSIPLGLFLTRIQENSTCKTRCVWNHCNPHSTSARQARVQTVGPRLRALSLQPLSPRVWTRDRSRVLPTNPGCSPGLYPGIPGTLPAILFLIKTEGCQLCTHSCSLPPPCKWGPNGKSLHRRMLWGRHLARAAGPAPCAASTQYCWPQLAGGSKPLCYHLIIYFNGLWELNTFCWQLLHWEEE